jgi:hypothetical protein
LTVIGVASARLSIFNVVGIIGHVRFAIAAVLRGLVRIVRFDGQAQQRKLAVACRRVNRSQILYKLTNEIVQYLRKRKQQAADFNDH